MIPRAKGERKFHIKQQRISASCKRAIRNSESRSEQQAVGASAVAKRRRWTQPPNNCKRISKMPKNGFPKNQIPKDGRRMLQISAVGTRDAATTSRPNQPVVGRA